MYFDNPEDNPQTGLFGRLQFFQQFFQIVFGFQNIFYLLRTADFPFDNQLSGEIQFIQFCEEFFKIDRENSPRPRKDFGHFSEVKELYGYMCENYYNPQNSLVFDEKLDKKDIKNLLSAYKNKFVLDDKQSWFDGLKMVARDCGFVDMKIYKANPEAYIGNIADASNIVRVALTGKSTTPDLYEIMRLLGREKIAKRLDFVLNNL